MIIKRISPFTGKENVMDLPITAEQIKEWENGGLIQKVMSNLTSEQREFLKTGITKEDWDSMFEDR